MYFDAIINCEIEKISFKQTHHIKSLVFKIQSGNMFTLIDIYFMSIHFVKSGFINS